MQCNLDDNPFEIMLQFTIDTVALTRIRLAIGFTNCFAGVRLKFGSALRRCTWMEKLPRDHNLTLRELRSHHTTVTEQ